MKNEDEKIDAVTLKLKKALSIAVPLWVEKLQKESLLYIQGRQRYCSRIIASKGDDLQFGGKYCAEAFNALAEGVAILAMLVEGGVDSEFGKFNYKIPEHWNGS